MVPKMQGDDGDVVIKSQKAVAEQSLYWRWLLIDEGSTASAEIVHVLECNLRTATRERNAGVGYTLKINGEEGRFGCLNDCIFADWFGMAATCA